MTLVFMFLQAAGCWNQLEISMVTGRNITTVAKQVERATHDLDLDSLQVRPLHGYSIVGFLVFSTGDYDCLIDTLNTDLCTLLVTMIAS